MYRVAQYPNGPTKVYVETESEDDARQALASLPIEPGGFFCQALFLERLEENHFFAGKSYEPTWMTIDRRYSQ